MARLKKVARDETSIRIPRKLFHDACIDVLHRRPLDVVSAAIIVLVDRLEPSDLRKSGGGGGCGGHRRRRAADGQPGNGMMRVKRVLLFSARARRTLSLACFDSYARHHASEGRTTWRSKRGEARRMTRGCCETLTARSHTTHTVGTPLLRLGGVVL